jgi:hypothetical protein
METVELTVTLIVGKAVPIYDDEKDIEGMGKVRALEYLRAALRAGGFEFVLAVKDDEDEKEVM